MGGGGKAVCASDGDKKEDVRGGASFHADYHGQSGVDVPESRAMGGGRKAGSASDGDEFEGIGEEHPDTLTSMANPGKIYGAHRRRLVLSADSDVAFTQKTDE